MADLEIGESHLEEYVCRWREAFSKAPDEGYAALRDAMTLRQAEGVGVDVKDWIGADDSHLERARSLVDEIDEAGLSALWDEPHALGWFHQHFGVPEREASNRAHTRDEEKHASQTATTQLYTPRWIADFLVGEALEAAGASAPTVCDPAVGGGQMLLAAADELVSRGVDVDLAVANLSGVDLDGRAVQAARRALKLYVAKMCGRRRPKLEAVVDGNLCVADGLFDDCGVHDVVITNPPYMGSRSMPGPLKERIRAEFRPFHGDLYTAFIRRCHELATGAVGLLAQQTIWFLSRFEKARNWLLDRADLRAFLHLGPHAFANLSGEKANVVAFVQACRAPTDAPTTFIDVRRQRDAATKRRALDAALADEASEAIRRAPTSSFEVLPGRVIAHWLPESLKQHFKSSPRLGDLAAIPGSQNKTGRNRRYVRRWDEVDRREIRRAPEICPGAGSEEGRWVFYSKGGRFAPWWGNWQKVVDWSEQARRFYAGNPTSNLLAKKWWFREGICYTDFGGRTFNARWMPRGCLFDMAGPAIFPDGGRRRLFALLALLNSTPARILLNAMNPSLHYQVRDLRRLPLPELDEELEVELAGCARRLVEGMQRASALVDESPRRVARAELDRDEVAQFVEELPKLERELDQRVCEVYGCSQLFGEAERSVHVYVDKLV